MESEKITDPEQAKKLEKEKKQARLIKVGTRGAVVLVIFGFVIPLIFMNCLSNSDFANAGTFIGGVVGPIFSLVGVILFALALWYQKKELELQREELSATRDELKGQREQMKGQKEQLKRNNEIQMNQQIESNFFKRLELHYRTIEVFSYKEVSGRKALRYLVNENHSAKGDFLQSVNSYFQNIFSLFDFISKIANKVFQEDLSMLFLAQLSDEELQLIKRYVHSDSYVKCNRVIIEELNIASLSEIFDRD